MRSGPVDQVLSLGIRALEWKPTPHHAAFHSAIELNSLWGGLARVTGVIDGRMEDGGVDTLLDPSG